MIVAGVDIGSMTSKALLIGNGEIMGWKFILTSADPVESASQVMSLVLTDCGLSQSDVTYIVGTGYGRVNVPFANATVTELSCHARGSHWSFPQVRTILDMGGQDCKAIRCDEKGRLANFAMNDKCAAGTGRYLERVAATLNLKLDEIGPLSLQPVDEALTVSDFCAVFAERDIVRLMREGKNINDILAAAHQAITNRVCALLARVDIERELCVSGGIAKNIGVVTRLEQRLGLKASVAPEPQIVGALGAALFATDRVER